jgi:predicted RND superfamily exporter protein
VPLAPAADQARLVDRITRLLAHAPAGARAEPVGLIATAAASARGLEDGRMGLMAAVGAAVFALLLAVRRRLAPALLALGAAAIGVGLVSLLVTILRLRLSPLSASAQPLGLAIGVEFGLLLQAGYDEARQAGRSPDAARADTVRNVGGAVAVSAVTVAGGFAVLLASRMPLVQQFGAIVALELAAGALMAIALVPAFGALLDEARTRPLAMAYPGARMSEARR